MIVVDSWLRLILAMKPVIIQFNILYRQVANIGYATKLFERRNQYPYAPQRRMTKVVLFFIDNERIMCG